MVKFNFKNPFFNVILSMHSILNSGLPIDNIWVFPVGPSFFFTFGSPHIFRAVVRNLVGGS